MSTKRIPGILCVLLCLLTVIGCSPAAPTPVTPQDPQETPEDLLTVIDGETDYCVVRGEFADKSVISAAASLRVSLIDATGVEVDIRTDLIPQTEDPSSPSHEILVGLTNRPESEQVYASLGEEEYAIRVVNENIVIIGKTDRLTLAAVELFLTELLQYDKDSGSYGVSSLKLKKDYDMKRAYLKPQAGVDAELLQTLALCVTEGGVPLDRDSINARFADYKSLGLRSVRLDLYWTTAGGKPVMQNSTRDHFEAARKHGLKLKLIINPGGTTNADPDSKLMDATGRYAVNAISPWYADAQAYTEQYVRTYLQAILDAGYADVMGAVVAGLGAAGEPLYPPAWTQGDGVTQEVLWCYADNAQADFRAKMEQKYGSIDKANAAWNKNYDSFAAVTVPREGEVKGRMWEDVLLWYRDSKREFMHMQVATFHAVMQELAPNIPLILYLPGADFTAAQWDNSIDGGTASGAIKIMCDNQYTVQLADEFDCLLQYTGITSVASLKLLRDYMFENDYAHIPVMGENAGGSEPDAQAKLLCNVIMQNRLWGIDYTHSHWLFEADGVTHSDMYAPFADAVAELATYLETVDITTPAPKQETTAAPAGDVLAFAVSFNKPESEKFAFAFVDLASLDFEVRDGDTLEYDVFLSADMAGLGAIDGVFDGGMTMRDNFHLTDSTGLRVHPNADLSDEAFGKWYHRVIRLGNPSSDGQLLRKLQLAVHPEQADGAFTQCEATIFYDNIVICRDGEVIERIFENEGDVSPGTATLRQYADGKVSITSVDNVDVE